MTVTYPINLPATPGIKRFRWMGESVVAVGESPFTLATQVQLHPGARWLAEVTLPPMERADAEEWQTFFLLLEGRYQTFLLGDPLGKTPRGVATGTPKVNGGGQTGNTLATKGWTNSTNNILRTGDYIQVGQRLYRVRETANSDGSGNVTLNIWPRLRESPANNDTIITTNCKGTFRLAENSQVLYEADESAIYGIAFTAMEAL